MKPDHQHIKSVKKNAKTFNACLTACWMSFSTETQQHRSTCHFSECLLKTGTWPTYMYLQKGFQPQIAMGLQIVICLLKFGQSWQVLSSCVKTGQHAEQRLTLSSDERLKTRLEIENHSSVTTLDSLTNLVDLTLGPLSTWLTVQQFCGRLIASSFHETCCTRYQEENKDISKFAIDLHAYVASTICLMYSTGMNQNKLLSQHIWEPCERSQGHHSLHVLCNGNSRRMVKPYRNVKSRKGGWNRCNAEASRVPLGNKPIQHHGFNWNC